MSLITRRSSVQIRPPRPRKSQVRSPKASGLFSYSGEDQSAETVFRSPAARRRLGDALNTELAHNEIAFQLSELFATLE